MWNNFVSMFGARNKDKIEIAESRSTSGDGVSIIEVDESVNGFYIHGLLKDVDKTSTSSSCSRHSIISLDKNRLDQDGGEIKEIKIKQPTSFWGTIFHMIFLSSGFPVLLIPGAFVSVGLVNGSVIMLIIFSFYVYKMRAILRASREMCKLKKVSSMTFSDLVYEAFDNGPLFVRPLASASKLFINLVLIFEWYGSSILIYALMVQNLQTICNIWLSLNLSVQNVVLFIFIPLVGLTLIRRLKFLQPCSILGFSFTLAAVFLVIYYSIMESSPWARQHGPVGSLAKISPFVGIIFSNINITGMILSLKYEMKHPEKFEARIGVLSLSYAVIFFMYFVLSMYFYFKYSVDVPEIATDVVPKHIVLSLLALISNVTGLYLSFPFNLYVPLNIIWNDLLGERKKLISNKIIWEYLLRILMVILIASVAYINLNLSVIVSLFGTICTSIDSIMLPAIIQSLVEWRVGEKGTKSVVIMVKNSIFLVFGVLVMSIGIMACVKGT